MADITVGINLNNITSIVVDNLEYAMGKNFPYIGEKDVLKQIVLEELSGYPLEKFEQTVAQVFGLVVLQELEEVRWNDK